MKKYIVVKHNIMRKQKFYKRHKSADSWSVDKNEAYKYKLRWSAEKIAKAKTFAMPISFKGVIEYHVEEVTA